MPLRSPANKRPLLFLRSRDRGADSSAAAAASSSVSKSEKKPKASKSPAGALPPGKTKGKKHRTTVYFYDPAR